MIPRTVYRFIKWSAEDRAAIRRAAKAISPAWSSHHFHDDQGASVVSIGPLAANRNAPWNVHDAFGLMALHGGRVELLDLANLDNCTVHDSLAEALGAMTGLMSGRQLAEKAAEEEDAAAA